MPMTPQERQLVDELFDKLASIENAPRDPDAAQAIADGQRRAPNATYALVQTVLLQDEALRRAHDRIQELEAGAQPPQQQGGFLDSMRGTLFGGGQPQGGNRGSVPSVRAGDSRGPVWNSGSVLGQGQGPGNGGYGYNAAPGGPAQQPAPAAGGGGSFLGTAAAAAAGMIGGSLLMNSMRGMFGGSGQQHGFGDQAGLGGDKGTPWGGSNASGGDLARDAGLNDIGKGSGSNVGGSDGGGSRQGFFDQASNDSNNDSDDDDDDDSDSGDFDSGGDSDYA